MKLHGLGFERDVAIERVRTSLKLLTAYGCDGLGKAKALTHKVGLQQRQDSQDVGKFKTYTRSPHKHTMAKMMW
jgi:hypothetical protein